MNNLPVIVVGNGLSVLGAIRLLAHAQVETYCFGRPQIEAHSRWYQPAPASNLERSRPEDLCSYLMSCPLERAVLLPASDAAVGAIADLPPDLKNRFLSNVLSKNITDQLCDKALFANLLSETGVPGPVTRRIDHIDALAGLPQSAFVDAFLKPVDSASFMTRFGVKGVRVGSREDAIERARGPLAEGHRMVLQEYIPSTRDQSGEGPAADHILIDAFVDSHNQIKAMFARRRLRMFPLDFGNSTFMVSIPLDEVPGPVEAVRKISHHLGYHGILSGEFKKDPRDGIYKLLEINSRLWWFVEFTGRCGIDMCKMSYKDALGEPLEDVTNYKVGAKFVHAYYDFHAVLALWHAGKIGLLAAALSWLNAQEPSFNWSDPMPALFDFQERLHIGTRLLKQHLAVK